MTMITPSYLGETIEYSSLHACRSTLEDPTIAVAPEVAGLCSYAPMCDGVKRHRLGHGSMLRRILAA